MSNWYVHCSDTGEIKGPFDREDAVQYAEATHGILKSSEALLGVPGEDGEETTLAQKLRSHIHDDSLIVLPRQLVNEIAAALEGGE